MSWSPVPSPGAPRAGPRRSAMLVFSSDEENVSDARAQSPHCRSVATPPIEAAGACSHRSTSSEESRSPASTDINNSARRILYPASIGRSSASSTSSYGRDRVRKDGGPSSSAGWGEISSGLLAQCNRAEQVMFPGFRDNASQLKGTGRKFSHRQHHAQRMARWRSGCYSCVVGIIVLLCAVSLLFTNPTSPEMANTATNNRIIEVNPSDPSQSSHPTNVNSTAEDATSNVEELPKIQVFGDGTIRTVIKMASEREGSGVLLAFSHCGEELIDWFSMPEHKRFVDAALERGVSVMAIAPENEASKCWSTRIPFEDNGDVNRVVTAVQESSIMEKAGGDGTPIYSVGVGNGAVFSTILATSSGGSGGLSITSQALYSSGGDLRSLTDARPDYAATIFIRMSRSGRDILDQVASGQALLRQAGVPKVADLLLKPSRLSPTELTRRLAAVESKDLQGPSQAVVEETVRFFQDNQLVDAHGVMHQASSAQSWRRVLRRVESSSNGQISFEEHHRRALSETFTAFYAGHGMNGNLAADVVAWLMEALPKESKMTMAKRKTFLAQ